MKPDPRRLEKATYPLLVEVPTRFGDLDPLGHVNNVAMGWFYEEGRAALNRRAFPKGMRSGHAMRLLIADVHVAYLREVGYPDPVQVGAGVLRIGGSSYVIALGLFQNGACAGACETVMVNTDGTRPAPLPDAAREALSAWMIDGPA